MRFAVSALLSLALGATPALARSETAGGAAFGALAAAHDALWDELQSAAAAAATRLGASPSEATLQRAFAELGDAARELGGRRSLLLIDPFGDVVVWGGAGLLHAVPAQRLRAEPCGYEKSAASVSLWCVAPFASAAGSGWLVLAGESFESSGEAPVALKMRGRFRVDAWRLAPPRGGPRPSSLAAEGVTRVRARVAREVWIRATSAALALLLAARGLARRGSLGWFLLSAALGFAFGAAGGSAPAAIAAGGGAFAAALAGDAARVRALRRLFVAAAAAAGPLLLAWLAWLDSPFERAGLQLFGGVDLAAVRLASSLFVFAAIRAGGAVLPEGGAHGRRWMSAAMIAALGGAFAGSLGATAGFAAVAGLAAASGLARLGARRAAPLGLALLVAALTAGAAAAAADWLRLRRAAPAIVEQLLPPRFETMRERIGEIEPQLEEAALATLARTPGLELPPADLAYAIWRNSPLARRDALTALAVGRAGVAASTFSFGLPIDGSGLLDPSPARWVELDPPAWRERAIAGELEKVGADGVRWRVRWSLVPRPGFADPAPPIGDLARGLLRGGAASLWLAEVTSGLRAVLYDDLLDPNVSPWTEGTPAFDPAWLGPGRAARVQTPDGPAVPVAAHGNGATAVVFVPLPRPTVAIERVGSFTASTVLLVAAGAGLWLLVTLRPAGATAALRRLLRSYSQRLVLVFSILVLVPTVLLYALLASALERRLEREQESRAREALHSAQRVLGEYVLSLEPGFGVDTALDDRLLEWLARVVRHEVNLYWGSSIYASSKRELFAAGLLPTRIPGEIWERIALTDEPFARRTASAGRRDYLELYAPLEVPGEPNRQLKLVLALPLLAQQEELEAEIAHVRRRALLGALALFGLLAATGVELARSFSRPIQELVAGTGRIAEGAAQLGFRPEERELESLALAIDQMAARIAEGRARVLAEKGLVERIVENVTAAVVGLDREGRVLLANRFARERLAAVPGESLRQGFTSAGLGALAVAFDAARPGVEAVAKPAFGEAGRNWSLVRVPLGAGDPAELVVVEDVTDVSRAQRLEAWAEMARIIAHEIKNPLTPIRLSTEHLRDAWARDRAHFEDVFERCTENILAQVEELRRTASEFSLYSEIPRIEKQTEDLGEIVAGIVDAYRAAPPAGVSIRLERPAAPALAGVDRRLIGRAVRNLIENALRAQPAGGEVDVEVGAADGRVFVRVGDRGPGVPPELLERILEPHFSTQAGGTGLGLPIARRVALEHGGELSVRNRAQGGFDVTITIPAG